MRDQYVGDISDVLKFSFLRALVGKDRRLGIAWYYAPGHDGRPDGQHVEWRDNAAWYRLDQEVCQALSTLPERSIVALERSRLWPEGSTFHREPMPSAAGREVWANHKREVLDKSDVVFLDPDNGLGSDSEKHATFAEVRELRRPGRAIVFITFPKRVKHEYQVHELHEKLVTEAGAEAAFTVRTNVSVPSAKTPQYFVPRARWFTVVDGDKTLLERAQAFVHSLSSIPRASAEIS